MSVPACGPGVFRLRTVVAAVAIAVHAPGLNNR
jgi:hypothetical protein